MSKSIPSSRRSTITFAFLTVVTVWLPAKPALAHIGHGAVIQSLANQSLAPNLTLTGLGIAFLFGSTHALSPGHGKTMVAAYLVGSRGTPKHALLLGLITTITHTFGVFALGLLTLFASQYILPEQLYPILSFISGLMVCGVGFWLLDQRLHERWHDAEHNHEAHHHHHPLKQPLAFRSLISLGIAGGVVPCPSALVLLLSAIALHQPVYGIVMVGSFSFGLASVLVAIGCVAVYAQQWINYMPDGIGFLQNLSIVGAAAVIVIGTTLTAVSVM